MVACSWEPFSPSHRHEAPPEVRAERRDAHGRVAPVLSPPWNLGSEPGSHRSIQPAFVSDERYADARRVPVRRLVYRVTLRLSRSFRAGTARGISAPMAELLVDLSAERLRAVFAGRLWPTGSGARVRLRHDELGAYVFDGRGGRPIGVGQLASWFAGSSVRHGPRTGWTPASPHRRGALGAMLCRLLLEWGHMDVEEGMQRCRQGGTIPRFRVGPWVGERMADVGTMRARRDLRADERDPPLEWPEGGPVRLVASLDTLRRTEPSHPWARPRSAPEQGGLDVSNRSLHRVLLLLEGRAAAWLEPGAHWRLEGLRAGGYRVAAVRPFGKVVLSPRLQRVPGHLVLSAGARRRGGALDPNVRAE